MGNSNIIEDNTDYIYYLPVGNKDKIDFIKNTLVNANVEKYVEYLCLKTIIPLASHKEILEINRSISIILDPIAEEAQAHAFAYYDLYDSHMLICLKSVENGYILTPYRLIMTDGNNPEKRLMKEFSRLSKQKLDSILLNTIKPVAIIGPKKNALLYVSKLTDKKILLDENINNLLKLLNNDIK